MVLKQPRPARALQKATKRARAKKRRRRTIEGTAEIDGTPLTWELISEPQWSNSGDGYKGMCIVVRVAELARRKLIIEYPYPKKTKPADHYRCRSVPR